MPTREKQRQRPADKEEKDIPDKKSNPFDDIIDESKEIIDDAERQQQRGRKGGQ